MCGIAGILRVNPPASPPGAGVQRTGPDAHPYTIPESWLDMLDAAIAHRGPDGSGRYRDAAVRPDGTRVEVALVHRRLSIIDHEGGAQPMVSGQGRDSQTEGREGPVAVVFNGCIYNHRELRAESEAAGRVFVSDHSDTEVLIAGYRAHHAGVIGHLDGMFAAAVWDGAPGVLTLMRDRFGEKPLFWWASRNGQVRAFASVPGVLARLRDLIDGDSASHREADGQAAGAGFARGYSEGVPPYDGVERVPPGRAQMLFPEVGEPVGPGCPRVGCFPDGGAAPIESVDELERLLNDAVASRMEADVPLGCFLSGGIDSSLITLLAARHRKGVAAVTVRMPDKRYDESASAEMVARHLGVRLEVVDCDGHSAAEDVATLIGNMQSPFADSSLLPTYWLCRAACRTMKVALSGDGGDELFFGYDRYLAVGALRRWGPLLRALPMWPLNRKDPTSRSDRLARLLDAARGEGWTELATIFGPSDRRRLLRNKDWWRISSPWAPSFDEEAARRLELMTYLPGDLLRKIDTASLSAGLEVRCPFLEPVLSSRALATPFRVHTRGGRGKALLRELAARHLPAEIASRPKQGFAVPVGEWFRTNFGGLKSLLMDVLSSREPFGPVGDALGVDMAAVRGIVEEHMDARRDHGQRLYALMVLGVWARRFAAPSRTAGATLPPP